jgi:hypothetical protein
MIKHLRHLFDWRKINVYCTVGFADTLELLAMQYRRDFELRGLIIDSLVILLSRARHRLNNCDIGSTGERMTDVEYPYNHGIKLSLK